MARYQAICEEHGECGLHRESEQEAKNDRRKHRRDVEGPHGTIEIVISN